MGFWSVVGDVAKGIATAAAPIAAVAFIANPAGLGLLATAGVAAGVAGLVGGGWTWAQSGSFNEGAKAFVIDGAVGGLGGGLLGAAARTVMPGAQALASAVGTSRTVGAALEGMSAGAGIATAFNPDRGPVSMPKVLPTRLAGTDT